MTRAYMTRLDYGQTTTIQIDLCSSQHSHWRTVLRWIDPDYYSVLVQLEADRCRSIRVHTAREFEMDRASSILCVSVTTLLEYTAQLRPTYTQSINKAGVYSRKASNFFVIQCLNSCFFVAALVL